MRFIRLVNGAKYVSKSFSITDIKYEVDSMETAKGLIFEGTGIGFLPELSVRREVS